MRLLQRNDDGRYTLSEFTGVATPHYAILSHTWGPDHDEVTLADLEKDTDMTKAGYKKLHFCADQAAKDDLRYFWVDTCCIDKTSSAELTEAINSMFKWYRKASQCCVYLSDVSAGTLTSEKPVRQNWYPAFQRSRWFTRGWTLQELLAPTSVEFFSVEGERLGNRYTLVEELHGITGVSVDAFRGLPLDRFSVTERMSWVERRQTKREEDMVYSLLGIFEVHMPLIYGEGRDNALARLHKEIDARSREKQSTVPQNAYDRNRALREPFSTIPFAPDPDFVDRPDVVAWVRDKCAGPGARAALVGLGGVGKSQLAIHHAYRAYEATPRPYVFWVHASTRARFEEAYRGIAERLELPRRHDPKADVLRLVSDWLHDEANGRWTMVLDNVDDVETFFLSRKRQRYERNKMLPASLAAYIPQSRNGSILITSRSKDAAARLAGGYQNIKEVLVMDVDQGIQLLWNKLQPTSTEEGASADLVRELDCMPLAISQAAAYINRRGRMTTAGYLYEFHANSKKKESLLNWDAGDLRRDESASNSVVTTWQMSFERVRQERPSAADLLSLMSFFNPQGIPEWTLRSHSKSVAEVDNNDDADRAFNEDIDLLQAYSLVAATAKSKAWEMHALVQYCTQVWLSSFGVAELWERKFVELMGQEFPTGIFENWGKCQELLPHCGVLYEAELSDGESVKKWAGMLNHIARYIQTVLGRYSEAEKLDRLALQKSEKALGKQHLSTLTCMNGLALVLKDQGKYGEAEILHRRALEGYEKELGEQHPDTLASVNNLASVLYAQGKYSEAEALIRWALEKHVKELGEQHPSSLTSMNNLASVLQAQEKYSEAETLGRRALERREKKLGEQHPDTLTSVNNLSAVLRAQGKYSEAETLSRRALEGYEKELGKQHPATLIVMGNLAKVLQQSGELCEAEILTRRVLEYFEKELGEQHPHTLTSVNNMALVLQDQKKYSEAETLIRRALEGRKKKLGEQHPSTLMSLNNLASVLQAQGKYSDAETLSRRGL